MFGLEVWGRAAPEFQRGDIEMSATVEAVKQWAKENYEQGGDIVVEAMSDEEIAALLGKTKSTNAAIKKVQEFVALKREQRANASSGDEAEAPASDLDKLLGPEKPDRDTADLDKLTGKTAPAAVVGMAGHKDGCKCVGCGIARKKASGEYQSSSAVAKVKSSQPKTPKTPNACRCGCGNSTLSTFAVGHDARFASLLKKAYLAGEITKDDAQGQADAISFNFGNKVRRMLDLADQEIAKAAKAEVAAGDK